MLAKWVTRFEISRFEHLASHLLVARTQVCLICSLPTDYTDSSGTRGGVVNLNSRQAPALAAVLTSTIRREDTPRTSSAAPSPVAVSVGVSLGKQRRDKLDVIHDLDTAGKSERIGNSTIANETGMGPTVPKTQRESIARALGEVGQTRTWNLLIDVIAQSWPLPAECYKSCRMASL